MRVLRRDRSLRPAPSSGTRQGVERPTIAVLPFRTLGARSRAFVGEGSGGQLWSERYNCRLDDIFGVRDRVVADIVANLSGYHGHIVREERRRSFEHGPASLDVYEKHSRGLEWKHRFEADTNRVARALRELGLPE